MSDDGLLFRCRVRAYDPDDPTYQATSNSALLTVTQDTTAPVWSTVPNNWVHINDLPITVDMNQWVTGEGLRDWVLSGNPSGVTINNAGVVTISDISEQTLRMSCYVANDAGSDTSNQFEWTVLPVFDVVHDFDTGDIRDFVFTRNSIGEVLDYQSNTIALINNEAGFVGLRKSGSSWVDEKVGYGLYQHPAYDTFAKTSAVAQFPALPGTPSIGVTNDYSGLYICVLDGDWASQEDGSTLVQFGSSATDYVAAVKNGNNLDAVCVIDGTTHTNSHTLTNTPSLTTLDLRVLKSRTDGFITWVNGDRQATAGATGTHTDRLDVISLGDDSNTIAIRVRTNTSAEDEGTITGWEGWDQPIPNYQSIEPTFIHSGGGEPPENPEIPPGVIFQTDWSEDWGVAAGYPDDNTGWDFDSDGVFNPKQGIRWAGEEVGVPTGFWTAVCDTPNDPPAPAPPNAPTRRSRIEIDPVYGNRCWRRRGGDEWYVDEEGELKRASNTTGNIYLGLPIGTRAAGYNDLYLRITMRWPTNNNYNYGSRGSYYKLGRFNANNYVPDDLMDPNERGRDQTGHNNASASETIIQMDGGAADSYYNRAPTFHVQPEDNWDDQYDTKWVISPSNNTSPSAGTWGYIAQDGSTEEAHPNRHPGTTQGQFVTYGDGNTGVEQEYHTIEYRIRANSAPYADDALISIFYDGVEQIAVGSTPDKPHFRTDFTGNWNGKPNPAEYINSPINANGVGFNWLRIFDNFSNWTAAWYGRRGDDFDGGEFIKDIVVSTERIGHNYKVAKEEGGAGFFQERGKNAQQVRNPGDCYIIPGNHRAPSEIYGPNYGCPNAYDVVAMFGFVAEHPVTPTWKHYRDIDNPGAVDPDDWVNGYELNDLPDWTARWGAMRYGQSVHNNSCCLTYSGSGLTTDDNGYLELTIDDGRGGRDSARNRIDIVGEAY